MKTSTTSDASTVTRGFNDGLSRPLTLLDANAIRAAAERVRDCVRMTPCTFSPALGEEAGVQLRLKRDDLQVTGSFKERGAANALALLTPSERRRGVVAASAGNHALGLARHGPRLGVSVTLVMPQSAARVKIERCRQFGARVVLAGVSFSEADGFAREIAARDGAVYVHPFDDPAVIAGQGTLGLEVLAQAPELSAIVIPVGGGGLLAGVALAIKHARPDVRVIAAEPAAAASFAGAYSSGRPVDVGLRPTLADGLAVARVGDATFAAARDLVDDVITVTEEEIAYAMLRLFEVERAKVEGSGAVALAALLARKVHGVAGRTVVVPVCGANVDVSTFARALELAAGGNGRSVTAPGILI